jgi:3-oxoacyl-[acyl-carrier protein] reductase
MSERAPPLAGKVAIVTGATRRIGLATVKRLAADGAAVVVTTRRAKEAMAKAVGEIEASGGRALAHLADLTEEAQVKGLIDATVAKLGRIDIIVHNAVDRNQQTLDQITLAAWRASFALIVEGGMLLAKYAAPHMPPGGTIVYLGGGAAFTGASAPAQPTAKMALVGLTRSLAVALGPKGIRVNCLSPGRIEAAEDSPERLEMLRRGREDERIPLRRAGTVDDTADAIAALVSDDMRYVTGQTLHLNGGILMG